MKTDKPSTSGIVSSLIVYMIIVPILIIIAKAIN
jgi:hypothetical protein